MQKTKYYSYLSGDMPSGCRRCVKGEKLVLFVTGKCPRSCSYCPVSDDKHQKDVVYADEWPVSKVKDIIKEAELIDAKGAGITGGDPLCRIKRTARYIRLLKDRFKDFHIHLYTSLDLVSKKNLNLLYRAGLDEIRFHLEIDNDRLWNKIYLALRYPWDVGVEIPVIPKKKDKIKKIISFIAEAKIKFLNLNELEFSDNSTSNLKGMKTKDDISYAVKGSEELALDLIRFKEKKGYKLDIHYCSAKLKDKVQLQNRIKRRAKNVKRSFDIVTPYGTLKRGAIYIKSKQAIKKLKNIKRSISFPSEIDEKNSRLIFSAKNAKKLKGMKGLCIVEEYPTHDQTVVELQPL